MAYVKRQNKVLQIVISKHRNLSFYTRQKNRYFSAITYVLTLECSNVDVNIFSKYSAIWKYISTNVFICTREPNCISLQS
jgi:hypothetical protein